MSPLALTLFRHHRNNPNLVTYASPEIRARHPLAAIDAGYAELEHSQYVAHHGTPALLAPGTCRPNRILTERGRTAVGIRTFEQVIR